jgi:hypothetical protein
MAKRNENDAAGGDVSTETDRVDALDRRLDRLEEDSRANALRIEALESGVGELRSSVGGLRSSVDRLVDALSRSAGPAGETDGGSRGVDGDAGYGGHVANGLPPMLMADPQAMAMHVQRAAQEKLRSKEDRRMEIERAAEAELREGAHQFLVSLPTHRERLVGADSPSEAVAKFNRFNVIRSTTHQHSVTPIRGKVRGETMAVAGMGGSTASPLVADEIDAETAERRLYGVPTLSAAG